MQHGVERVQRHDGISGQDERIRKELEIKDKARASFYRYFANREWGAVSNYNMVLDTGIFTKTQCVDLIETAIMKVNGGTKDA